MTYETRITRLTVLPKGEPLFAETATHIQIEDEAAGEFISIEQTHEDATSGKIVINTDEWPAIRDSVERLLADCRVSNEENLP